MSFLGAPYRWDVFVSYSHGKTPPGIAETQLKAWTRAFVAALREDLHYAISNRAKEKCASGVPAEALGEAEIWYDIDDVDGNDYLTDQLSGGVRDSALLLIIMTTDYLNSRWCREERQWFEEELHRRGQGVRNVFVLKAMPTDASRWPGRLKDVKDEIVPGYTFYPENVQPNVARPFGWPVPTDSKTRREFHDSIPKLSAAIANRLQELVGESAKAKPLAVPGLAEDRQRFEPPIAPAAGPVYLAPCSSFHKTRDQIRRALVRAGASVLPETRTTIDELAPEAFDADLSTSRVFAQVLGVDPHSRDTWGGSVVMGQYQRARDAEKPCVSYCQPGLIPILDDEGYRRFVEGLLEGAETTPEGMVRAVIEALQTAQPQPMKPSAYMHCPRGARKAFLATQQSIEQVIDCKVRTKSTP